MKRGYSSQVLRIPHDIKIGDVKHACNMVGIQMEKIRDKIFNFHYMHESDLRWIITIFLLNPYPIQMSGMNKVVLTKTKYNEEISNTNATAADEDGCNREPI